MDLLYMREPPGLQLLHCIENTCQGGESFFADTFTALHQAEMEHASTITNLSKKRLRYAYHTGGQMVCARLTRLSAGVVVAGFALFSALEANTVRSTQI